MKQLILFLLLFNSFYCSSSLKDVNDLHNNNHSKQIYVCNLPDIIIDSSLINFYDKKLNVSVEDIKDSVSKYIGVNYSSLSRKCLKQKIAALCDSDIIVDIALIDSCYLNKIKVKNYNNTSKIFIKYPDKRYLDSIGIRCDYGLFISDITLFTITTGPAVSNCRIWNVYSALVHVLIVEAAIKGKYVFWDYNNSRAESAGEFRTKFGSIGLDEEENINKTVYSIIARILYKSSYWKISNVYYVYSKTRNMFYH